MKLSKFVADSPRFCLQLRESEAVISGSFALQFFERITCQDSDLDIFIKHGNKVGALSDHLTAVEGYQLQERDPALDETWFYRSITPIHQVGV
jgi:hypothetical protein